MAFTDPNDDKTYKIESFNQIDMQQQQAYFLQKLGDSTPYIIAKVVAKYSDVDSLLMRPLFAYHKSSAGVYTIIPFELFQEKDVDLLMYTNRHARYTEGDLICGFLNYDVNAINLGSISYKINNRGAIRLKKLTNITPDSDGTVYDSEQWQELEYEGIKYLVPINIDINFAIKASKNKEYSDYSVHPKNTANVDDLITLTAFKKMDYREQVNYVKKVLFEGDTAAYVYAEPEGSLHEQGQEIVKYKLKLICNHKRIVKPFMPFYSSLHNGISVNLSQDNKKELLEAAGLNSKSSFITRLIVKKDNLKGSPFDLDFSILNPIIDLSDYEVLQAITVYKTTNTKKWIGINELTEKAREELNKIEEAYKEPAKEYATLVSNLEKTKSDLYQQRKELEVTKSSDEKLRQEIRENRDTCKRLEAEQEKLEAALSQLEATTNSLTMSISQLEPQKEKLSVEVAKLQELKEQLKAYDIDMDKSIEVNKPDLPQEYYVGEFDAVVQSLRSYIYHHSEGWNYSTEKIVNLLLGIYSGQLILLVGNPGSGKTSFVQKISRAIGYESAMIPVQSNWMDKSDLLGYYNPLQKVFVPTAFTETLVEYIALAEKHPDRVFMICLDEMNLAHIEYYFADFLSALQTEERVVKLYSRSIYQEVMADLNLGIVTALKAPYASEAERTRVLKEYDQKRCNLLKYRAELHIPENICFVGTLNQDATTKDLSPKVIDRAYFIRMDEVEETTNSELPEVAPQEAYLKITPSAVSYPDNTTGPIKAVAAKFNVILNYRLNRVVKNITKCVDLGNKLLSKKLQDYIFAAIVLPRLKAKGDMSLFDAYPMSRNLYEKYMLEGDDVSYWRSSL